MQPAAPPVAASAAGVFAQAAKKPSNFLTAPDQAVPNVQADRKSEQSTAGAGHGRPSLTALTESELFQALTSRMVGCLAAHQRAVACVRGALPITNHATLGLGSTFAPHSTRPILPPCSGSSRTLRAAPSSAVASGDHGRPLRAAACHRQVEPEKQALQSSEETRRAEERSDFRHNPNQRINAQWRICLRWPPEAPGPTNVEIADYH